jgi:hypothetical protein
VFFSFNLTTSKLCYFQFQKASEKALKEFYFMVHGQTQWRVGVSLSVGITLEIAKEGTLPLALHNISVNFSCTVE